MNDTTKTTSPESIARLINCGLSCLIGLGCSLCWIGVALGCTWGVWPALACTLAFAAQLALTRPE